MVLRDESGQITGYVSVNRDITERKRAEEEIKSLAKFPSENPNPILRIDQEGILLYANQAAFLLLADWNLQIGQAVPEVLRELMRETFVDQRVQTADIPCGERVFSVAAAPITETGYINLYIQNVTERKRAEEALLFTRFSLDNAVETMACVDHDAHFIDVNNAFCRVSGHSREELLSMTVHDIDPDYSAEIWPAFWNKLKQSGSLTFESYHRSKEGRIYPVEITATYFEYNGKEYHCSFARDITERKRVEEALREAEAWFRTTLYSIGDAVITTDAKSRVQQMNPVAEAFTGWREAEARGKPLAEVFYIVNQETRRAVENPVTRVLREGVVIGLGNHTLLIARDGTERPISDAGAPIRNDRGETVGVVLVFRDQTAERAAQKALRESEARFSTIFRASPIGIGVTRLADGQVSDLNDTFLSMFGYVREEVIGRTTLELKLWACPEDRDRLFKMLLEQGRVRDFEAQFRKKSGEIGTLLVSAEVIDLAGERYMLSLMHDITERKRAEEALRQREREFSTLAENATDMIVRFDTDLRHVYCNAAVELQLGVPASTFIGKTPLETGGPREQAEFIDKSLRQVLETGQEQEVEQSYPTPSGSKHFLTRIVPERDEQGKIESLLAITRDITERKRAEEALRESEGRFRLLYEKAPLGYQSLDAAGCFIDVNQAWLDTLGYSREEVIGRWFGDFLAPHEVEAFKQRFAKFKATGEINVEVEMVRKDGAHAIIAIVGRIAYDEHGGFKQTHCILTDITERKRAEEALRESRTRLAHLSRRLVDAQEQERRRIARELHDEVGQSLTALTISLDGVSQLALEGAMRGKIAEIQELTKNLIAEVNALSVELRPRVLDDLGLIPGLLSLFSRFSTQTGVEIDFKHTSIERKRVTPEIEISAYRIIQEALTNVVRHAGVKTASVRLQVEADMLWIQVQDEGKGFNLQQAMKAEDSMGLLSMTERAEQVGGKLEVETAPGEGAIITCRLPLAGNHTEK
jgi:PAS domain S-box-containing protein